MHQSTLTPDLDSTQVTPVGAPQRTPEGAGGSNPSAHLAEPPERCFAVQTPEFVEHTATEGLKEICSHAACEEPRAPRTGTRGRHPVYCETHLIKNRKPPQRPGSCSEVGCGEPVREKAYLNGPWPTKCVLHTPEQWVSTAIGCPQCRAEFAPRRRNQVFCSVHCSDVARGQRRAFPLPARECALSECNVMFVPQREAARCCSERHGKMLYNRESRADGRQAADAWNDRRRDSYHRRRAIKKDASTGERVSMSAIAERDGWVCGICGGAVDQNAVWPDNQSKSLDHVIPLTKGGLHDPSNVQLAHLGCNSSKGNRLPGVASKVA